MMRLCSMYGQM